MIWSDGGAMISVSFKQKINTALSTKTELIRVGNLISKIVLAWKFLKMQGFSPIKGVLFQDNRSKMVERNGFDTVGKGVPLWTFNSN